MKRIKVYRKHKDKLLRIIFRKKRDLLQLYNAINGSNYTNPEDLVITTLEDAIYMGMKNDLSFIIDSQLNLYEHQSTYSPNLPLRGLLYFSELYRSYIEPEKKRLYTSTPLLLPLPQYIVFYNGTEAQPERQELLLSDLFQKQDKKPALECTAIMLNINLGQNRELMEKCRVLEEYARFVACLREYVRCMPNYEEAVKKAVDDCIRNNILSEVLRKNRAEVMDMILTEFDEEEFREFLREEAREKGLAEGRAEGRAEGHAEGLAEGLAEGHAEGLAEGRVEGKAEGHAEGIRALIETCRELGISYQATRKKLEDKLLLSQEEIKKNMDLYWKE